MNDLIQNRQQPGFDEERFQSVGELNRLPEHCHGASVTIAQLSPGSMEGAFINVELGSSSVHLNQFSLNARGVGITSPDRVTLITIPSPGSGRYNSTALVSDCLYLYPPGTAFEGTIQKNFSELVVTIGMNDLNQLLTVPLPFAKPQETDVVQLVRPEPHRLDKLKRFAARLLRMRHTDAHCLDDWRQAHYFHTRLVEHAASTLDGTQFSEPGVSRKEARQVGIVRRVETMLEEDFARDTAMEALCAASDASERTLRNAFNEVTGLGPKAYLRALRLSRVRCDLERHRPSSTTVKAVAQACGITHFGRFSDEYRRFFGELPSATLARPAGAHA